MKNHLEEGIRHYHLVLTQLAMLLIQKYRSADNINLTILLRPVAALLLYRVPYPRIQTVVLRTHIGHQETFIHRLLTPFVVTSRTHVSPVETTVIIIRQSTHGCRHLLIISKLTARQLTRCMLPRQRPGYPIRLSRIMIIRYRISQPMLDGFRYLYLRYRNLQPLRLQIRTLSSSFLLVLCSSFLLILCRRFIARSISSLLLILLYNKCLLFCCQRRNLRQDRKRHNCGYRQQPNLKCTYFLFHIIFIINSFSMRLRVYTIYSAFR